MSGVFNVYVRFLSSSKLMSLLFASHSIRIKMSCEKVWFPSYWKEDNCTADDSRLWDYMTRAFDALPFLVVLIEHCCVIYCKRLWLCLCCELGFILILSMRSSAIIRDWSALLSCEALRAKRTILFMRVLGQKANKHFLFIFNCL